MDRFDRKTRSRIMSSIKSRNTGPEIRLFRLLNGLGVFFVANCQELPGKPDAFIPGLNVALFVDGCFWHGCPEHFRMPRTNRKFWRNKIDRNARRDREVDETLLRMGIVPVRVWEHDMRQEFQSLCDLLSPP